MENVDFLVIGSGFAGATFARQMTDAGKRCIVVEKRNHIGGNSYSERREGIDLHLYGIHVFHCNDAKTWNFVNRFGEFNNYRHIVRANVDGFLYPLPINLMTMHQMWDVSTPDQARAMMACQTTHDHGLENVEGWCLANIGYELYEQLIEGYTTKQWGKHPRELPSSIIKRLPVRFTHEDCYFRDRFQGVPVEGYGRLFERILEGIEVRLSCDYLDRRDGFKELYPNAKVVYTGPLDALFDCDEGSLEYRSLRFEHDWLDEQDHQGIAQLNWPSADVPWTRTIEHSHLNPLAGRNGTFVTSEFPEAYTRKNVPYYPIADSRNRSLADKYIARAKAIGVLPLGRLGTFSYQDMNVAIAQAMTLAEKVLATCE